MSGENSLNEVKIKVYAEDSLENLFIMIDKWSQEKKDKVEISLIDLRLMKEHIEDLEQELFIHE